MSNYTYPKELKKLKACVDCHLVKTMAQFQKEGCDNCRYQKTEVSEKTTSKFKGIIAITDPKKLEAMVIADGDNFSLAIGKKGQNARLATRLTKFKKIDIKTSEQAREAGINFRG